MKMKWILALMVIATFFLVGCGKKGPTIKLTSIFDGSTVDLCEPIVRKYLSAEKEEEQIKALLEKENEDYEHQAVTFSWESDGSTKFILYIADNEAFENAYEFETTRTELTTKAGVLVPGTTYYWKVVGDIEGSTSKVDTFQTLDAPVRFISTAKIPNVRDLGGWKTESGKKVKYGLLYRGGKTNPNGGNSCMEYDEELFAKTLGIKTEIDLRTQDSDDGKQTESVFGTRVAYQKTTLTQYSYIFPSFEQTEPIKRKYNTSSQQSIQAIFKLLSNEKNYPMFIHCNAGADRTGTVAFLINGVLGVSYEDLTRDFELSKGRYRSQIENDVFTDDGVLQDNAGNYIAWDKMYRTMLEEYGTADGTLASAIENYLITVCNVDKQDIEKLKSIMLE